MKQRVYYYNYYDYHNCRCLSYLERVVSSCDGSKVRCCETAVKCEETNHAKTPIL
jgi:predicted transcriptional regulator with HTH domain